LNSEFSGVGAVEDIHLHVLVGEVHLVLELEWRVEIQSPNQGDLKGGFEGVSRGGQHLDDCVLRGCVDVEVD
jgi:hypothetical protein